MVASRTPPTGDLACNPGLCPDWESNWQPFGSQAGPQPTEPHHPGLLLFFLIVVKIHIRFAILTIFKCIVATLDYIHNTVYLSHLFVKLSITPDINSALIKQ